VTAAGALDPRHYAAAEKSGRHQLDAGGIQAHIRGDTDHGA